MQNRPKNPNLCHIQQPLLAARCDGIPPVAVPNSVPHRCLAFARSLPGAPELPWRSGRQGLQVIALGDGAAVAHPIAYRVMTYSVPSYACSNTARRCWCSPRNSGMMRLSCRRDVPCSGRHANAVPLPVQVRRPERQVFQWAPQAAVPANGLAKQRGPRRQHLLFLNPAARRHDTEPALCWMGRASLHGCSMSAESPGLIEPTAPYLTVSDLSGHGPTEGVGG